MTPSIFKRPTQIQPSSGSRIKVCSFLIPPAGSHLPLLPLHSYNFWFHTIFAIWHYWYLLIYIFYALKACWVIRLIIATPIPRTDLCHWLKVQKQQQQQKNRSYMISMRRLQALSKSSFAASKPGKAAWRKLWIWNHEKLLIFLIAFCPSHLFGLWCLKRVESTLVEISSLSSWLQTFLEETRRKSAQNGMVIIHFIQIRCGRLLEETHFWQLIVPRKDKRKEEQRALCRSSHHSRTKPLFFLILREKREWEKWSSKGKRVKVFTGSEWGSGIQQFLACVQHFTIYKVLSN